MREGRPYWLLLMAVVLVVGFGVRVWRLNGEAIWHDEGWSIRAIRGPFTTPDDNTPYGYYATLHLLWKTGIGETPFAFRYGSVLFGLLTVAVALRVGWEWYGGGAALSAGLLVATSPLLWEYAQEVRAYVVVPLVALLLLGGVEKLLRYPLDIPNPRWLWGFLFSVELAGLYTHNLVVPLVIWMSVAVSVVWLWRWDWRRLFIWGGLHMVLILAYVPWLLTQSPSGTLLNTPPEWDLGLVKNVWYSYFLPVLAQVQATDGDSWLNLAGLTLIVLSIVVMLRERSTRTWLLVSHAILVPIFSTLLLRTAHIDFHPRYYIAAVPGTLLLAVAGVATLRQRELLLAGYSMMAIGGVVIAGSSLREIADTREYQHDDFAELAAYYATLPDDAVILIPFAREPALQNYYAHQNNIRARFVNVPLYTDEADVVEKLSEFEGVHVEFLTWFQLPADMRGMYPCLLAASSEKIGESQDFFGLNTQAYKLTTAPALTSIDAQPNYREVGLQDLRWQASSQALCVRATWALLGERDDDLSASVRVLNEHGWIVTQEDTVIRDREQVATHEWNSDGWGASYHLLKLPDAAPIGDYRLEIGVYSDRFPNGLDVLSAEGSALGKAFHPATMIQAMGPPLTNSPSESQLLADNSTGTLDSGTMLETTVLLVDEVEAVTLVGDGWEVRQEIEVASIPQLGWYVFHVPSESEGEARLLVGDRVLATYTVVRVNRLWEMPAADIPIEACFSDVGMLVAVSMAQRTVSPNQPPQVTLIWQAEGATIVPLVVFVQLVDESGRLLAQSDSPPVQNQRPTTSWVLDEYIVDNHTLTFRVNDYEGAAYLIAGLYDPDTFERVPITNGSDYFRLPVEINVIRD